MLCMYTMYGVCIVSYPEATAKELKHNIQWSQPQIKSRKIISIGSYCWDKDVNEIFVSGFLCRKGQYHNSRVLKVNDYI